MRAGIVWSVKKSVWTPTQSLEWIGFLWDSSEGTLKVKERMLGETARKLMVVEIDKTDVVQLHMVEVVVYEMFVVHMFPQYSMT